MYARADSVTVFNGCQNLATGVIRLLPSNLPAPLNTTCNTAATNSLKEVAISWNQVGPQGQRGATGAQGPVGATGALGAAGPAGPQGPSGATGATGPAGASGPKGDTGVTGPTGPKGDAGVSGSLVGSPCTNAAGQPSTIAMTTDADDLLTFRCVSSAGVMLTISPASYDFGAVLGASAVVSKVFTVTDTGTGTSGPPTTSGNELTGTGFSLGTHDGIGSCTGQNALYRDGIAPHGSCTVAINFTPYAPGVLAGVATGNVIVSASPGGSATATFSVNVVSSLALVEIAPTSHDFGTLLVGSAPVSEVFSATNRGNGSGTIATTLNNLTGTGFSVGTNTCANVILAPAATCTVSVAYTPGTSGPATGELIVSVSPGHSVRATFSANASTLGVLSIAPTSYDFGTIHYGGTAGSGAFTVTNIGTATSGAITTGGTASGPAQVSIGTTTCPSVC